VAPTVIQFGIGGQKMAEYGSRAYVPSTGAAQQHASVERLALVTATD